MKAQWKKIAGKIEARSLRERLMFFVIAALLIMAIADRLFVSLEMARQQQLSQKISTDRQQTAAIRAEIQARASAHAIDPDAATRLRLQQLNEQSAQMRGRLEGMQKGLVSPDKMADVLKDLLQRDGKLRLKSLKTLPVASLNEPSDGAPAQAVAANKALEGGKAASLTASRDMVYKHGVEIVVEGSYADIAHYLAELERLPWQLFWAGLRLEADGYPAVRLTLTLFTLSLDKTWLNI